MARIWTVRKCKLDSGSTGAKTARAERSTIVSAELPEISRNLARCEQVVTLLRSFDRPQSLIIGEKEQLILDNRAANRTTELIPTNPRFIENTVWLRDARGISTSLRKSCGPGICVEDIVA